MNLRRRRIRTVDSTLCAAAFFCLAGGVSAQAAASEVDANGRNPYSDRVGATPLPVVQSDLQVAVVPARAPRISPQRTAVIEANEAARRLKQARLTRDKGAEPLPAERMRGAGADAVNYRYWRRQERLRHEVEQALRRSNSTNHALQARR